MDRNMTNSDQANLEVR